MKSESLVIANQNVAVNTFSGLVHTARHFTGIDFTGNLLFNSQERIRLKVGLMTGDKS